MYNYGYEVNSRRRRPSWTAARRSIDQPFGSGRALLFGVDPFYRAWNEAMERQALNG